MACLTINSLMLTRQRKACGAMVEFAFLASNFHPPEL
jgi:hypothetical protein